MRPNFLGITAVRNIRATLSRLPKRNPAPFGFGSLLSSGFASVDLMEFSSNFTFLGVLLAPLLRFLSAQFFTGCTWLSACISSFVYINSTRRRCVPFDIRIIMFRPAVWVGFRSLSFTIDLISCGHNLFVSFIRKRTPTRWMESCTSLRP